MPPYTEAHNDTATNLTLFEEFLDGFDWNKRDTRLDGFPLMSSIWPSIYICLGYIYLAKIAGPIYMRNRNPLRLKTFAQSYNTIQFLCELLLIPWLSVYFFSTRNDWRK